MDALLSVEDDEFPLLNTNFPPDRQQEIVGFLTTMTDGLRTSGETTWVASIDSLDELKRNNSENVTFHVYAVVDTVLVTDTSPRPMVLKAFCHTVVDAINGIDTEAGPLPDAVDTLSDLIVKSPDGDGSAALKACPLTTVDTEI